MQIELVGTESLGVRGLCCVVKTPGRYIVIDPGIALGYLRGGLLPHPRQVAVGDEIRTAILEHLGRATDIIVSHYHGDHIPLADANPFQLHSERVKAVVNRPKVWLKPLSGESSRIAGRKEMLEALFEDTVAADENSSPPGVRFSKPLPHGRADKKMGTVMMTRIEAEGTVFVHASDIQLLEDDAASQIAAWSPDVLFVSGPPLYRNVTPRERSKARGRVLALAGSIEACIIDHHLLRCREGIAWLDALGKETGGRVLCAADFMNKKRCFLEARRRELYQQFPVPDDWHTKYRKQYRS